MSGKQCSVGRLVFGITSSSVWSRAVISWSPVAGAPDSESTELDGSRMKAGSTGYRAPWTELGNSCDVETSGVSVRAPVSRV